MQHDVTSEQNYSPEMNNQEGDRFAYEAVHATDPLYFEYQCMNCGEGYQPGAHICISCGLIFSDSGNTEKLDDISVDAPRRTRRIGELVADAQRPIVFVVDDHALTIPVADVVIVGRGNVESSEKQPDIDLTPFNAKQYGISRQHLRLTRTHDIIRAPNLC